MAAARGGGVGGVHAQAARQQAACQQAARLELDQILLAVDDDESAARGEHTNVASVEEAFRIELHATGDACEVHVRCM